MVKQIKEEAKTNIENNRSSLLKKIKSDVEEVRKIKEVNFLFLYLFFKLNIGN